MYKLDLPLDTRESIAIERRRNMEKQRQARIFNAKERTIGVDVTELDKQVNEKKEKEKLEREHSAAFAEEMVRNAKVADILQERKEREKKDLNESLVEYWYENQRPQDRREFDLNDPESKTKDVPARVSDSDPRMSLSGMQAFSGEDLQEDKRKSLQKEQMRDWLSEQIEEKKRLSMEENKANHLHDLNAMEIDKRAQELVRADEITRRTLNVAIKEYNQALAKEKEAQKHQSLIQEMDDNYTEMSNHVNGDILTENPTVAQSALGQHRFIPDRWKGMSQAQIDEIRETQAKQREDKKHMKEDEQRLEHEWDRKRLAEAKVGLVLQVQEKRAKDQLAKEQAGQNKLLATEQQARREIMDRDVYVNTLSDAYFEQFGTSSR